MKKLFVLMVMAVLLGMSSFAVADSISPSSFTGSGPTGASYTVNKTVTVSAGAPTTSLVDVFFLCDTTGSMGDVIAAVRNNATAILAGAAGLGDVAFGVGEYKDRTTAGDPYDYRLNTAITTNAANVTTGINLWAASGGGDTAEQNLYALSQVATNPATGWRVGAAKLIVWFGDAPSHDPSGSAPEPLPRPVTLTNTEDNLTGNNVKVAALDISHFGSSLDADGQATAITTATGGAIIHNPDLSDPSAIVALIQSLITSTFAKYTTVSLDTSEVPAGVGVSVTPGSYVGAFDRSVDRTFDFEVTFTDLEPGTHTFNIYALVDGGRVATESDSITSGAPIPEPATMFLLGSGLIGLAGFARRRFKK
jgi:hypothetical protein